MYMHMCMTCALAGQKKVPDSLEQESQMVVHGHEDTGIYKYTENITRVLIH